MTSPNRSYTPCLAVLPLAYQTIPCDLERDHQGPHAALGHFDKIMGQLLIDQEHEHLAFDYAITWSQRLLNPPTEARLTALKGK